jgi:hypothetical protein
MYTVYILLRHGVIVSTGHNPKIVERWRKDHGKQPSYEIKEVSFTL